MRLQIEGLGQRGEAVVQRKDFFCKKKRFLDGYEAYSIWLRACIQRCCYKAWAAWFVTKTRSAGYMEEAHKEHDQPRMSSVPACYALQEAVKLCRDGGETFYDSFTGRCCGTPKSRCGHVLPNAYRISSAAAPTAPASIYSASPFSSTMNYHHYSSW